jgi:hypothetical protein
MCVQKKKKKKKRNVLSANVEVAKCAVHSSGGRK